MKRIITLILATLVLLSGLSFAVFAESDAMEELNLFGIVPDSITAGNLEEDATRQELAYLASRIVSGYAKSPQNTRFTDVTVENLYSGYIEHMASLGVINGKGDGLFDPNSAVKPEMAAKVFVNILGYETFGEFEGGYPDGYMKFAGRIGISQYLVASKTGNLSKGALLEAARYVLVTGFNKPEYIIKNGETTIAMTDDKASLLGSALKISVYTGEIKEINPKNNSVTMYVSKNKYDTNFEELEKGLYTFDLDENIDSYEFENLPVTAYVTEEQKIIKLTASKNAEVKYGYVDSVNGKPDDSKSPSPISNISEITILDDEDEYSVSEDAKMRYNNKDYSSNVSLVGKFVKMIVSNNEVTFIETWDLKEGGLLTTVSEDTLTFARGTQKSASLKEISEYDVKRVFINNKVSDYSFLKEKTVFDYFEDDEMLVIVDSEKQIADTLYSVGELGIGIGNATYMAKRDVYYSENGVDFKVNDYEPFFNMDVYAYLGPDANVRYVILDSGQAATKNKIYASIKGYDQDIFGEETTVEVIAFVNGKIETKRYQMSRKTTFGDGLSKEIVLAKSMVADDTNIFVLDVNADGVIKSVENPMTYSGFLGNSKGTVSHIIDSYLPQFDISGRRMHFTTDTPIMALYEKEGTLAAKTLTWNDNLRGRGNLATPLSVMAIGDETKSSSPALIFVTGDINTLSSSTSSKFGIVIDRTIGVKDDGSQCVNLKVLEGGVRPVEYAVSSELAEIIPEYALISYASFSYAPGEQGSADDIMLREITSGGETHQAIDLSSEFSLWPEEDALSSAGFHKGIVDAIDSVRMLTTGDYAAYVDQAASGKLLCVKYNANNPSKRFEGIELTDIGYGDEVYYYSNSTGYLKMVIKMS